MLKNCMPRLSRTNRTPRNHLAAVRQLPVAEILAVGKVPVARPQNSRWGGHKQLVLAA
jgi:hypothetical protein